MSLRRFKPYPAYNDSGIAWIGKIPEHWSVRRLKTFATVQLSNVDKKSVEGQEAVGLCNYTDVYYHERITAELDFMAATATPAQVRRFALQAHDVIITKDSESWTDIAVPAVVSEDLPGVLCGYHLAHIRPTASCYGPFLARAFAAVGPRDQFRVAANGITRFGLGRDAIASGVFAVPPESEQRSIAAFLDRETARIDTLVAKKERLIELLHEQRIALIASAVAKGLDANVPMKDSSVERLGSIPAHWDVKPIGSVAHSLVGFPFPSEEFSFGEGVRLVRGDNVTTEALRWGDKTRTWSRPTPHPRYYLMADDIVIGMDGSKVGRNYAIVREADLPLLLVQRVARLRARPIIKPAFLFWSIAGPRFHAHVDTHKSDPAIPHITLKDIETYQIALPSVNEQLAILNWIGVAGGKIYDLEKRVHDAIDRLKDFRASLISAAVTGKIDVREEVS